MHEPTDDFLDKTRTFWQSRTDRDLTAEDARQIAENVSGFLQTLIRWQRDDSSERGISELQEVRRSPGRSSNGRTDRKAPDKRQSARAGRQSERLLVAGNQHEPEET